MISYPHPWRWEPNGAGGESLMAADGTEIIGGGYNCRVEDPIVRVALQHALETANALNDLTGPGFTACDRKPECGGCTCCRAFGLFTRMTEEIAALSRQPGLPS